MMVSIPRAEPLVRMLSSLSLENVYTVLVELLGSHRRLHLISYRSSENNDVLFMC